MSMLEGPLAAVFGAAFAAVLRDGVLQKMAEADLGTGGFTPTLSTFPVKLSLDQVEAAERAATGVPAGAVRLIVLRAGLPASIDLDDAVLVGGATYRVIRVDGDPAMVSYSLMAVPA